MTLQNPAIAATSAPVALVERKAFAAAVARVARVVEKRNSIPILSNVLLAGTGESLTIEGSDLDTWLTVTVPAAADSRFTVTVPAHMLADTLKRAGSEYVAATQGDALALDFEGAATTLQTLPVDYYPPGEWKGESVASFTLATATLRRMLAVCSPAISTEETRYYLNGVYLHVAGEIVGALTLRATATDGHRLASATVPLPEGAAGLWRDQYTRGVILPRKAVALILAELKRKGAPESVAIDIGAAWARFTVGDAVIRTKLIDGTFPDYVRVIPAGNDKVATVAAKPFAAMVRAVSSIADRKSAAPVRLTFGADDWHRVTATMRNPDSGSASQFLACVYEAAKPIEIGFNPRYLAELVDLLAAENVRLEIGDPGSPMIFKPGEPVGDGVEVMAVCMPMRLKD